MKKIYIDDSPLRTGHSSRGMGMYTRNLIEFVRKDLAKNNLEFSEKNYDLLHIPYFDLFFHTLKNVGKKKVIVTVPDVIPLLYPKQYPSGMRGGINFLLQKRNLQKVDAVITISETSKKDIVRFLGINPDKVHVTYLAPNFKFKKSRKAESKYNLPKQFVLYVGDVNYNKNIIRLVEACKDAKLKLVIVGKQAMSGDYDKNHIENQSLITLQKKYGSDKDIIKLGFLSNEELNKVWNQATIYCQPSLYEGFGLPVLEAMQAGVPVVAAKTQALVEIGGDACSYFDPYSVSDLSNKLKMVVKNKDLRETLMKKGREQVEKYSWKEMAHEVISVYKKVLAS